MKVILEHKDIVDMVVEAIQDILRNRKKYPEKDFTGMDITDFAMSDPDLSSILRIHDCYGNRVLFSGRAFITGVEDYDIEFMDYYVTVEHPEQEEEYVKDMENELTNELIEKLEDGSTIDTMDFKKMVHDMLMKR